jgi:predicted metal-dependent peptidase
MKINIHEYITLKGKDEWLVYQVDRIDFTSDNKAKKKAYCFSVKGKFNIFLSKDILEHESNEFKVEVIKHELGHGMFGHLMHNKGKTEQQRQLLNILFDCSIHQNLADLSIIEEGMGISGCSYEKCNLPVLPPLMMYNKLSKKIKQLEDWIKNNLSDTLWKQQISEEEQVVITSSIETGLQKAKESGCEPPHTFTNGGTHVNSEDVEVDLLLDRNPDQWLDTLLRIVRNYGSPDRRLSYKREPRNPIDDSVLQKGLATEITKSKLVFAVDCSGSMNKKIVDRALSTILSLGTQHASHEVLLFDNKISARFTLKDGEKICESIRTFWGGTDVRPVLSTCKPQDQLIIFTDGGLVNFELELSKFSNKPIWVLTESYYKYKLDSLGQVITTYDEQVYN